MLTFLESVFSVFAFLLGVNNSCNSKSVDLMGFYSLLSLATKVGREVTKAASTSTSFSTNSFS
jgi:hypothetical protein